MNELHLLILLSAGVCVSFVVGFFVGCHYCRIKKVDGVYRYENLLQRPCQLHLTKYEILRGVLRAAKENKKWRQDIDQS